MRKTLLLFALTTVIAIISTPLQANASSDGQPEAFPVLAKNQHALPQDEFWDRLAQCETAQDWQNGGTWAGGLGIYTRSTFPKADMGTWERFGGEEFAPTPDKATREQQIEIANRIAVKGWSKKVVRPAEWAKRKGVPRVWMYERPPVGLNGWGCYKSKSTGKYRMERPKMYYHEQPHLVPLLKFRMGEKSHAVEDLQTLLGGLKVDGVYGKKTRAAHIAHLRKNKVSTAGVPPLRSKPSTVSAMSVGGNKQVMACPKWEPMLRKYRLPVKEFSYIMWRESRCRTKVIGWNYHKGMSHRDCRLSPAETYKKCKAVRSYDSGLLQINSSWKTVTSRVCKSKFGDLTVLLKADCNLRVAKFLYEQGGGINNWKATSGRR